MTLPRLWSISYSPWSDKARWALDHCGVAYERRSYQPLLGELALRRTLGVWRGPVSVPILEVDGTAIRDSWKIAEWASAQAAGEDLRLFPADRSAELARYNELSEAALSAGRTLGLRRLLDDGEGLLDLVPARMRALGAVARGIAAAGVRRTIRKYAHVTPSDLDGALIEMLERLRADLKTTKFLLGKFSYADIVMAEALAFVAPPATHLRLAPASRRAYTHESLATKYVDVVAWRDALYAQRKPDAR